MDEARFDAVEGPGAAALPVPAPDGDDWPDSLEVVADEVVQTLRWQLGQLRLTYLNPAGFEARRRVFQARNRVFTLLTGMNNAHAAVVSRMVTLAVGGAPGAGAPSPDLDSALHQAIDRWRAMELPSYWKALASYTAVTKVSIAEQIMLLTYLETILPAAPAAGGGNASAPDSVDLAAAVAAVSVSPKPADIYAACAELRWFGVEPSTAFTTQVAALALSALTLSTKIA